MHHGPLLHGAGGQQGFVRSVHHFYKYRIVLKNGGTLATFAKNYFLGKIYFLKCVSISFFLLKTKNCTQFRKSGHICVSRLKKLCVSRFAIYRK